MSQPAGWSYAVPISVHENQGVSHTNTHIKLRVNTQIPISLGRMRSDGGDIRFSMNCNGSPLLDYYLQAYINTDTTLIWLKIPSLPANSTITLYMFYGNPGATSASTLFAGGGPHSSTDSVQPPSTNTVSNSMRGFRFRPKQDVVVTHFGKRTPNTSTRWVALWDWATQTKIYEQQITGNGSAWAYAPIPAPIILKANKDYYFGIYQGTGDQYFYGSTSQIGQHLTYVSMVYCNSCTKDTWPTQVLTNYQYGVPDFWYYVVKQPLVAPTVTIGQVLLANAGADKTTCPGVSVGLSGSASGGGSSYTYAWTPSATLTGANTANPTATTSSTTNYTLTVTDNNGCKNSDAATVTISGSNPTPNLGPNQVLCGGASATLTPGSYSSYNWSTGSTASSISVTAAGSYSVTVTNSAGCVGKDTVVINTSSPTVNLGPDQTICQGGSAPLNAGGGFSSYSWSTGATSSSISATAAGTYTVTVTDALGCTATDQVVVSVSNPTVNLGPDQTICQGSSASLNAGSGFSAYSWSNGATTQTIAPTTAGTYSVTVTDGFGCTASDAAVVTVSNPSINLGPDQTICNGGSTTLNAGAGWSSYSWSNGGTTQTITASTSGTYSVTVTNGFGCSATDQVVVSISNPQVNLGPDQTICNGSPTTLNAGSGFTAYSWSTGATSQSITASVTGSYSVTVTDANSCTAKDTIQVNIANPSINLGPDQAVCQGQTVTLNAGTGFNSYAWNTSATTQTITVGTTGSFSVTGTDQFGCTASDTANVTINPLPVVNLGPDQEICSDATTTLDAGNAGATYSWSNGATTQTVTVSNSGTYSVLVTNQFGCQASDNMVLVVNAVPVVNLGQDQEFCAGDSASLDAGNAGLSHLWSTGATTQMITVYTTAIYSVQVTDTHSCTGTDDVLVTAHPNPVVNLGPDTSVCVWEPVTLIAPAGMSSYTWSNGLNTQVVTVITQGTYWVYVYDQFGCYGTDTVEVDSCQKVGVVEDLLGGISFEAFPNPFETDVTLRLDLDQEMEGELLLVDMTGRIIAVEEWQTWAPGRHESKFDGRSIAAGNYTAVFRTEQGTLHLKLVLQH